jgi:hypothetical protein
MRGIDKNKLTTKELDGLNKSYGKLTGAYEKYQKAKEKGQKDLTEEINNLKLAKDGFINYANSVN